MTPILKGLLLFNQHYMNRLSLLFVLLTVVFSSSSCEKIDEWTHFTKSFDEDFTMPAIPVIIDTPIPIPYVVETNSADTFEQYNTSPDLIEEVNLTEASLQIVMPNDASFSFLKSVKFYLEADGLKKVLIASKENVPVDVGQTLDLEIVEQDLSAFLVKEEITIILEVATDEVVAQEIDMKLHVSFLIDAKILGV